MNQNKVLGFFNSIILFSLGLEFFALMPGVTVYRLITLPLSILSTLILIPKIKIKLPFLNYVLLLLGLILINSIYHMEWGLFLSVISLIPFILYVSLYYSIFTFSYKEILIFSLYSLPHIIALFLYIFYGISRSEDIARFSGAHIDSNHMCIYVGIGLISTFYFFWHTRKKTLKLFLFVIVLLDLYTLLLSLSRGGILSIILVIMAFLVLQKRYAIFTTIILLAFYLVFNIDSFLLFLPKYFASGNLNLFQMYLIRFTDNTIDDGGGRLYIWAKAYEAIQNSGSKFIGAGYETFINNFRYAHSTFIDLILSIGLFFGIIVILILFYNYIKFFISAYKNKDNITELLIMLVTMILSQFSLISVMYFKLVWLILLLPFIIKNAKIKNLSYESYSSNYK